MGNQELIIQRHRQYWVYQTQNEDNQKTKQTQSVNSIAFCYHSAFEIWPDKSCGLWQEWPDMRDDLWWEWPDMRDDLLWEWPDMRDDLWWEQPDMTDDLWWEWLYNKGGLLYLQYSYNGIQQILIIQKQSNLY